MSQLKKSQTSRYQKFFESIDTSSLINAVTQSNLKKHNIILLDQGGQFNIKQQSYKAPKLYIKYTQKQATIVQYEVIIAKFKLQITMINFDQQAPKYNEKLLIGAGAFGTVRLESSSNKHFIVKRQKFMENYKSIQIQKEWNMNANKYDIEQVIYQYCFYKICSLYKIGPAVDTDIGFDILCYKDHIEFHLQFCDIVKQNQIFRNNFRQEQFEKQMKQNLKLMHEFKLIHKDVKPDNMLYSHQYKRYVLSDFGLSHSVEQNKGQKTKTYYEGSPRYMCEQMKNLICTNKLGQVDLYHNDLHGLRQSIRQILRKYKQQRTNKISVRQHQKCDQQFLKEEIQLKINQNPNKSVKKQQIMNPNPSKKSLVKKLQKQQHRIQSQINIFDQKYSYTKLDYKTLNDLEIDDKQKLQSTEQTKKLRITLKQQKQKSKRKEFMKQIIKNQEQIQVLQIKESLKFKQVSVKHKKLKQILSMKKNKQYLETIEEKFEKKQLLFTNISKGYYEYLKLKYVAIKDNISFQSIKESWDYLNIKQILQIQKIILYSSNLNKKKQVYNIRKKTNNNSQIAILSEIKQSFDQKQIIIDNSKLNKDSQLKLKNYMRIYGYDNQTLLLCEQLAKNYEAKYDRILTKIRYNYQTNLDKLSLIDYNFEKRIVVKQLTKRLAKEENTKNINKKQIFRLCLELLEYIEQYEKQIYLRKIECLQVQRNEVQDIIYKIEKLFLRTQNNMIKYSQQDYKRIIQAIDNLMEQQLIDKLSKRLFNKLYHYGLYTKSIVIGKSILQQNKYNIVFLYKLIQNYINLGLYKESYTYSYKLIVINKQYYGQQHPNVAKSYHQASVICRAIGKYQQALRYLQKSILMHKKYYGQEHPDIASSYHQLSIIYNNMGKKQQALKYAQCSIVIKKKLKGQQDPSVCVSYYQISQIYMNMGKYQYALKYSQNSIRIKKKYYGQEHPKIAASCYQLSLIYYKLAKYQQSLKYLQKSLYIYNKYYDQQYISIAALYHQLSLILSQTTKYQQALKYSLKSIAIQKKHFGQQHPNIVASYHQLSFIYSDIGKYQQSLQYGKLSLAMAQKYDQPGIQIIQSSLVTLQNYMNIIIK